MFYFIIIVFFFHLNKCRLSYDSECVTYMHWALCFWFWSNIWYSLPHDYLEQKFFFSLSITFCFNYYCYYFVHVSYTFIHSPYKSYWYVWTWFIINGAYYVDNIVFNEKRHVHTYATNYSFAFFFVHVQLNYELVNGLILCCYFFFVVAKSEYAQKW